MNQMFETQKYKIKGVYKRTGVYECLQRRIKKKFQMTSSRLLKVGQTGFY